MLILPVRHEKEKLREPRSFTETCYPGSGISACTDGAGHWPASGRGRRLDPCITEVEMPGATRFDLTRALREQDGRTKAAFIAVTRLKVKIGTIIL